MTCRAIAIGRLYQGDSSPSEGGGAPSPTLMATEARCTNSGTPMASAYQTQLTRQRISRAPSAFSPLRPSVSVTTISAASSTPGAKKLFHGIAPHARA